MLMLGGCLVLVLAFSQATAYTLMAPKIYGQSMTANTRGWPGVVSYPFRAYQPSLPPQYYGRYYSDPYFAPNMQNADYFYSQDPYTAPFDDSDYYSNYLYYIPSRRLYYDQPMVDSVDDIQDYDDEAPEEDNNYKLQRDWWLEKNVMPNEDTDFDRFQFDDFVDYKLPKSSKKMKNKELQKSVPKPRYAGIDGFGRKKDKEQVFGRFQFNPRREDEAVYAKPTQSDDKDVKELKKLYKEKNGRKEAKMEQHGESSLKGWMSGHVKKSVDSVKHRHSHQQSWTKDSYDPRYEDGLFEVYNEGGQMKIPESSIQQEERWAEYAPEETSVFDTIKKLLALEDDSDQDLKINKRVRQSSKSKISSTKFTTSTTRPTNTPTVTTTIRQFPDFESQSTLPPKQKNHKRSAIPGKKQFSNPTDEESLVQELSALRHRQS